MAFTGVANKTSTPIGWEDEWVAMNWRAKAMIILETAKMSSIGAIITFTYHTK